MLEHELSWVKPIQTLLFIVYQLSSYHHYKLIICLKFKIVCELNQYKYILLANKLLYITLLMARSCYFWRGLCEREITTYSTKELDPHDTYTLAKTASGQLSGNNLNTIRFIK